MKCETDIESTAMLTFITHSDTLVEAATDWL